VACAPYRARTKGKDERGVGYVKGNALAGRTFGSWEELDAHLVWWMREIADIRVHGTTGERPIDRFKDENLRPLTGRPPFQQIREVTRRVQNDACVEVDTNHYSVPWRLIGEEVVAQVTDSSVRISHAGKEVACHAECEGRRQYTVDRRHLEGIVGADKLPIRQGGPHQHAPILPEKQPDLLRPLSEYEVAAGGGW
jgi:transposase